MLFEVIFACLSDANFQNFLQPWRMIDVSLRNETSAAYYLIDVRDMFDDSQLC